MTDRLPQKYQEVAKAIIPYTPSGTSSQLALITIDPALPCFLCGQPGHNALITPAPDQSPRTGRAWLTFPICSACEKRQIHRQSPNSE